MKRLIGSVMVMALVAAPAFAGGAGKERAEKLPKKTKSAIEQQVNKFEQAWNQANTGQMASVLAPDAHYINPAGEEARGRQEIQQLFEREFDRGLRPSRAEITVEDGRMLSSNLAFVDMMVKVEGMRDEAGQQMPGTQEFHAVAVFKREGNQWMPVELRPYRFIEPMPQQGVGGAGREGQQPVPETELDPEHEVLPPAEPIQEREPMPQRER